MRLRPTTALLTGALILLLGSGLDVPAALAPPATDIWLLPFEGEAPDPAGLVRVTDRPDYDNQPAFHPELGLLYTAAMEGQTDIFRYDPETGTWRRLTETPESEYSPTPVPWSDEISVVRVESDGTQRLWAFPVAGGEPRLLLPGVEPVGYHAWLPDGSLALFVLGEPPTLQLADLDADTSSLVVGNIGRSLEPLPDPDRISFLQRESDDGPWAVRALNPETSVIDDLGTALEGSQDLAWHPDGRMLMGRDSRIYSRRPEQAEWRVLADLAPAGISGITRIAVASDGSRLAVVGAH